MSRLKINLSSIEKNFKFLKKISSHNFICPMVKCNAYSHGLLEVSRLLDDLKPTYLGLSHVKEALKLKKNKIKTPILVFSPYLKKDLETCLDFKFTPVITQMKQLEILNDLSSFKVPIHLKFNTGMNRVGLHFSDLKKIKKILEKNKNLQVKGLATHFSQSYDAMKKNSFTLKQSEKFDLILDHFPKDIPAHALNSQAIKMSTQVSYLRKYGLRPGLALYGYDAYQPFFSDYSLRPALELETYLADSYRIQKGDKVSYSCLWKAKRKTHVGVIPLGYAHGFNPQKAFVVIKEKKCPVIGEICMDHTMLDLTDLKSKIKKGEKVIVVHSKKNPLEELSKRSNLSVYRQLLNFSSYIKRDYLC